MFKLELKTILLLVVIIVVGWSQWKIYKQEDTIYLLKDEVATSKEKVLDLTLRIDDIRKQITVDRVAVDSWFAETSKLKYDQKGHQDEVKNALKQFQFKLSTTEERTETPEESYRIGDSLIIPAIDGMWNAYNTTTALSGGTESVTIGVPETSTSGTTTQ